MKKQILVTGDRPTGKLHLGHYVGTLRKRVELQDDPKYKQYVFISDQQALTDNARNPELIRTNLIEVALDYLAVGISPEKTVLFVQSQIPELAELTMYYMNLVTVARLQRNPTVKEEIKQKEFKASIPAGFLLYPVSQAADITAFEADFVPAGEDQEPVIEQTREIVRTFNSIYGEVLVEPQVMLPDLKACNRLPGVDGQSKMSKSLGNAIYLADKPEEVQQKIMKIFTDPNHLKVSDPGTVEGNTMFTFLDAFCTDTHFVEYLPEYSCLEELKEHYRRGGLGDIKVKKFLNKILQAELAPIRQRRQQLEENKREVYQILLDGSLIAREVAAKTLERVRNAIGLNYFDIIQSPF
jgi:tryptophanyl-tRNA synthetase